MSHLPSGNPDSTWGEPYEDGACIGNLLARIEKEIREEERKEESKKGMYIPTEEWLRWEREERERDQRKARNAFRENHGKIAFELVEADEFKEIRRWEDWFASPYLLNDDDVNESHSIKKTIRPESYMEAVWDLHDFEFIDENYSINDIAFVIISGNCSVLPHAFDHNPSVYEEFDKILASYNRTINNTFSPRSRLYGEPIKFMLEFIDKEFPQLLPKTIIAPHSSISKSKLDLSAYIEKGVIVADSDDMFRETFRSKDQQYFKDFSGQVY